MSPSALSPPCHDHVPPLVKTVDRTPDTYLMDRDLNNVPHEVIRADGNYIYLDNGQKMFDAACGAAVACLGHGNEEVRDAVLKQMQQISYCHSMFFRTPATSDLAEVLIAGTNYKLAKAFIICSGSEAMEAAMKLGLQYYVERKQPQRVNFIAREHSYHGSTLGALSMSGHVSRRAIYLPLLSPNIHRVSACNPYRQRLAGENDTKFVKRKAAELEAKFLELGPDSVIGFVCEPTSGAALGCVPAVPGYLAAMKEVCARHGALFILDEVMCGMGRTGTLHAWQADDDAGGDCVPDIQTIGKGLGGGYQPIAAVLINAKIAHALKIGTGAFMHGQTYQAFPVSCAAALAVQRILRRDDYALLSNVRVQGVLLARLLREYLSPHPNVGDIRGAGLFWGVELVRDKGTKEPFDARLNVASRVHRAALGPRWNMSLYPGQGSVDGVSGDHVIIAPAFGVSAADVEGIAWTVRGVVEEVFEALALEEGRALEKARAAGVE